MYKKVIFFILIIFIFSTTTVFAEGQYYLKTSYYNSANSVTDIYEYDSTTPYLYDGNNFIGSSGTINIYKNGVKIATVTNSQNLLQPSTFKLLQSSHHVYNKLNNSVFFKAPLTPIQEGMEGAQQTLMSQVLTILPIILGMLLLVIGFRKAYQMLSQILGRA
jgi:hypothetical protein